MIEAKLIRDTTTRVTSVELDEVTGEMKGTDRTDRVLTLALTGAQPVETGHERRWMFDPTRLIICIKDGAMTDFKVWGYGYKADGTIGKRACENWYDPNGTYYWERTRQGAPTEIMEIVRRYAA
jgi:hypothetical protein